MFADPSLDGAILALDDVNEYIYRVDRLAGVVLGAFTNCTPGEGYGTLTIDEVFDDCFKLLNLPVYGGAQFGHVKRKWTLPIGLPVEIDADAGTLRLPQAAVG